jgi:predicted GIY-YIG superfamily endonuclease
MLKCMITALASMAMSTQTRTTGKQSLRLEQTLRMYRTEQAYIRAVPASAVFGDKLMKQIAHAHPSTLKQLMNMKGIGATRFENYGRDIVRLVNLSSKAKPECSAAGKGKPGTSRKPLRIPQPRPRPRPRPKPRPRPRPSYAPAKAEAADASTSLPTSVYILELEGGRVYVGSSTNVQRRIAQHNAGTGSAFTRAYKPTGTLLPRLGNIQGSGDAAERDETLRYMFLRGIPQVRGWKFSQVIMTFKEFEEAESNIRELFNLCRRCGRTGHFITRCPATVDRWGRACTERS